MAEDMAIAPMLAPRPKRFGLDRRTITASCLGLAVALFATVLLVVPTARQIVGVIIDDTLYEPADWAELLGFSLPLMITSLGASICFRGQAFNLGLESQVILGAAVASLVGAAFSSLWSPAHIALLLVAGGITGGIVAGFLGWLYTRFGIDIIVTSLLSNYVISYLVTYLANYPFRDPSRFNGAMFAIAPGAELPSLVAGTELTWGIAPAVLIITFLWWTIHRAKLGRDLTLAGQSTTVALATGLNPRALKISAIVASGFLAGFAGALLVSASQHRYFVNLATGVGFSAVLVAMTARYRILAAVIVSLVYSWMYLAADSLEQEAQIPAELAQIIIVFIVISMTVRPKR